MTEMQKEMQKLISKDELDKAFDARFPKQGLADLAPILQSCLQEVG